MNSVRDLDVYKMAFRLTIDIYKTTKEFPSEEKFGLISQMRRSAISINSNLVEGSYRNSTKEYRQFVGIANGSAAELRFQIEIAKELGFIEPGTADNLIRTSESLCRMLTKLSSSLEKSLTPTRAPTP